ncbi:type I 3-dehydroquinate dehydratase [Candidatus Magnetomonas plexicatena]|uniref:type I 3-dehydroquinate dehydratase n=1 Tax=Candidatus Magnetomonas plexicatena TaxID=2552947 RepID=UPI001103A139|nr:type I 3-dehydroquinate dehydratase [Nitrospirales bacterium LBB_01]
MKDVKIGNLTPGKRPLIVVPLTDADVKSISDVRPASMIELRIDMFSELSKDHIITILTETKTKFNVPIIATCRAFEEGGAVKIKDSSRIEIYSAAAQYADAIDVELNTGIFHDVLDIANHRKIPLIASFHDFTKTPPLHVLESLLEKSKNAGADIMKIALMANTTDDIRLLTNFTIEYCDSGIVCIAMGAIGMASRVFFPLIGSLFTFASLETTTAPGQISLHEMAKFYDF